MLVVLCCCPRAPPTYHLLSVRFSRFRTGALALSGNQTSPVANPASAKIAQGNALPSSSWPSSLIQTRPPPDFEEAPRVNEEDSRRNGVRENKRSGGNTERGRETRTHQTHETETRGDRERDRERHYTRIRVRRQTKDPRPFCACSRCMCKIPASSNSNRARHGSTPTPRGIVLYEQQRPNFFPVDLHLCVVGRSLLLLLLCFFFGDRVSCCPPPS